MVVAGGVLSVIQLVNQLVRLGVEARIVTLFEDPAIHRWARLYTRPIVFRNAAELRASFPETDVVVATLWTTAAWAREVLAAGRARTGVYFLQDYEPWFFPEESREARTRVRATFGLLDHRIVKSEWLRELLAADGYASHKISLGMDLSQFYARAVSEHPVTLLAMARPGTAYRGFSNLVAALAQVRSARPRSPSGSTAPGRSRPGGSLSPTTTKAW